MEARGREHLSGGTAFASTLPLPTTLGEVSVRITDSQGTNLLAGLLAVSPEFISYIVPPETADGEAVVVVFSGEQVLASGRLIVRTVAPGLFAANANGQGPAAAATTIQLAHGETIVALTFSDDPVGERTAVPIDLGTEGDVVTLSLFGTGFRQASNVEVTIDGIVAEIVDIGPSEDLTHVNDIDNQVLAAVGMVPEVAISGVDAVIVRLPRDLAGRGEVNVAMTVDGVAANPVTIRFP